MSTFFQYVPIIRSALGRVRRRRRGGGDRSRRPEGSGGGSINYRGHQETPVWDPAFNQWGFWLFGVWVPL